MIVYESVWSYMTVYRLYMKAYGCTWVYMTVYDAIWV